MKEVEVKAKIANLGNIKQKLASLGCEFSEPIVQDDRIYLRNGTDLGDARKGVIAMRLRDAGSAHIFNMKIEMDNALDNTEYETKVDDPEAIHNMLKNLGYYVASHVHKKRMTCAYKDMEICLDEVRGLGSFIETEKLTEEGDSIRIQDEMFNWLETLGVSKQDRVTKGYDILMYEKEQKGKPYEIR